MDTPIKAKHTSAKAIRYFIDQNLAHYTGIEPVYPHV